jgi:hypothetical protein
MADELSAAECLAWLLDRLTDAKETEGDSRALPERLHAAEPPLLVSTAPSLRVS